MQALRVATFNLENLDGRNGDDSQLRDRVAVLRPQLLRLRADILCLQEVGAQSCGKHGPRTLTALDAVVAETPYARYQRVVSLNRSGHRPADHHNLVTLSRWPIRESRQVWHDLVPSPTYVQSGGTPPRSIEWDRPLLHTVIDSPDGRPLHVFNVHLRAPRAAWLPGQKDAHGRWQNVSGWAEGFFMATMKQAGQALEARLAVDAVFDRDIESRVVVCGDFNSDDREAAVRIIRGDEEDTGNGHLAGRVLIPVERSLADSQRYSVIHHGRRIMLDHILVSRSLFGEFLSCTVHNEALGDELVSPTVIWNSPESYHAPLVAEFTMSPTSGPLRPLPVRTPLDGGAD